MDCCILKFVTLLIKSFPKNVLGAFFANGIGIDAPEYISLISQTTRISFHKVKVKK